MLYVWAFYIFIYVCVGYVSHKLTLYACVCVCVCAGVAI